MKLYLFHPKTKEYLKTVKAKVDLLKSTADNLVYIIPENTTSIEPLKTAKNETCIFNGKWEIVKDYRGTRYFDTKASRIVEITELGEIPDYYLSLDSKEFQNYIQHDETKYKKVLEEQINNFYERQLETEVLIGKYYFAPKDYSNLSYLYQNTLAAIENIKAQLNITNAATISDEDLINDLLHQLKQLQWITLAVKNKRRKKIRTEFQLNEVAQILTKLKTMTKELQYKKSKYLTKLLSLKGYELALFEQRIKRGLENEEKGNETLLKKASKTN